MTFTLSSVDEFNQSYPVLEVNTPQEASDLLEEIDIAMDDATGYRYQLLHDQYHQLKEQLSLV